MNLSDIHAWLASEQDFAQGCALYAALGTSAAYKRLFNLAATPYSRQVLTRELGALVAELDKGAAVVPEPAPPAGPVVGSVPLPPAASPDPESPLLANLDEQLRAVRDERSHLHPQLTAKGTGQKRRQALAGRIVALSKQEGLLKAHAGHVRQHGRLPGPVALADVTDAGELRQRLLNLRCRRSKLKKDPDRAAELARVVADIDLIQSKLTS
ncbi:MAG: hypothetical protein ACRYFZ_19670 [Janthinobacterium lividum]